ncbi:MAG: glycoside hydrolase family 5 protein [Spirochaetales bacterium]|nr:glycoside hydrolase family 5 protein [Spirochaetales bacterium]
MKKSILLLSVIIIFTLSSCVSGPSAAKHLEALKVVGSNLCDSQGNPVQLRGMSSHKLQHFGRFMNVDTFTWLRDEWKCNVVRGALYTYEQGYISNFKEKLKKKMIEIVEGAIDTGIYVIIDWHILRDGDPNIYKEESKEFFIEMATMFGEYPNVIYEICNEPNGKTVTWGDKIKPYADYIIPAIRAVDPDNIIIVGSGTWSQDIHDAAADPLEYENIMYSCHFYAGSHHESLRTRINDAITGKFGNVIPVFVTEWGTTDSSGNGPVYEKESKTWITFLNENNISWVNWSLCDMNEGSAALLPGAAYTGGWPMDMLSESGSLVYSLLRN